MPKRQTTKSTGRRRSSKRRPADNSAFFEKTEHVQRPVAYDRQIVKMMKIVPGDTFTTNSALDTFASYFFSFGALFDQTELAAVFDQYRIDRVDFKLTPNITESLSSTPVVGALHSCFDFDDANLFTSITDVYDYSNAVTWKPTDVAQGTLVPHFAYAAFATGVFSSFANSAPKFIDCASPGVQHYGLKLAATPTGTAVTYTVRFRFHLSLRMTH